MRFVLPFPLLQLISGSNLRFIELAKVTAMHFQRANAGGFATCTDDNNLSAIRHQ
jgi:hypothetical protein